LLRLVAHSKGFEQYGMFALRIGNKTVEILTNYAPNKVQCPTNLEDGLRHCRVAQEFGFRDLPAQSVNHDRLSAGLSHVHKGC
jgi:hypothetical protein